MADISIEDIITVIIILIVAFYVYNEVFNNPCNKARDKCYGGCDEIDINEYYLQAGMCYELCDYEWTICEKRR